MQKFIILIIFLCFVFVCEAQVVKDTLDITLTSFVKKEGSDEILYIAVFIKSNLNKSVVVDDSQNWIKCPNTAGVKLLTQYLTDSCFSDHSGSDCHVMSEDKLQPKKKVLDEFSNYSYIIPFRKVAWLKEDGENKRIVRAIGVFRFNLELPFWVDNKLNIAKTKKWLYYAN